MPPWVIKPEEYPHMPFVREAYICNKYMYRKYFKKEVGDEQASGSFTDKVFAGIGNGLVQKLSPGNPMFPWQPRFLKFGVKNGEPALEYYKDEKYLKVQGAIMLQFSEAELLDRSECDKDHPHCFLVKTSPDSEHQGREFRFSADSPKSCVAWVESIRRHSGQLSFRTSKLSGTPIMSQMEMERLNLKRNVQKSIETNGFSYAGPLLQREAYAYGRWYSRYALVTKNTFHVFLEEGGQCILSIPLKGAKVDNNPLNILPTTSVSQGAFGVLSALSQCAYDAGDAANKQAWTSAINGGIITITIGK